MFVYERGMPNDVPSVALIELSERVSGDGVDHWNNGYCLSHTEHCIEYALHRSRSGDEMRTNTKFMLRTHEHSIESFCARNLGTWSLLRIQYACNNSIEIENGREGMETINGIDKRHCAPFNRTFSATMFELKRGFGGQKLTDRPAVTHMIT